ncbi:hypothetical protein FRC11_013910 [Ceratobasidium sp. 423]|nr:hypothetical protein FRC11_013910 [Ceratobasidium sp. 423]
MFVSRVLVAAGAILASVYQPGRLDPRGLTNLSHQGVHQTLRTLWGTASASSPAFKIGPLGSVSRFICSKGRVSRRRPPLKIPTPLLPRPTFRSSLSAVVFGAACYAGPMDLAVYSRPSSLVIYAPPTQHTQFLVDPRLHQVAAHFYRPRFRDCDSLFKEYAHLDPGHFERWVCEATNDPTQPMVTGEHSILHEVLGLVPSRPFTTDDFKQRPEERASLTLACFYAFGALVSFFLVALEEYSELQQTLENNRRADAFLRSDSAALRHIESQIPLDETAMDAETEPTAGAEGEWWNGIKEGTEEVDFMTTYLNTSISQSTPPFDPHQLRSQPNPLRLRLLFRVIGQPNCWPPPSVPADHDSNQRCGSAAEQNKRVHTSDVDGRVIRREVWVGD